VTKIGSGGAGDERSEKMGSRINPIGSKLAEASTIENGHSADTSADSEYVAWDLCGIFTNLHADTLSCKSSG
jgi:hypothetical protein